MIHLKIIDELGKTLRNCAIINNELSEIIAHTNQNLIINISLIDTNNDTYFNTEQLHDLRTEIEILIQSEAQQQALNMIYEGILSTLEEGAFSYLKFEIRK